MRGWVFDSLGKVLCELEELAADRFRVVKVYSEREVKMPCFVCGVWKPITEMWIFVEVDGWRMYPFCSEECFLAYMLRKEK